VYNYGPTWKILQLSYECLTMDPLGKTLQVSYECPTMDPLGKHYKYHTSVQPWTYECSILNLPKKIEYKLSV